MTTVRRKSIDPMAAEYLRAARAAGLSLSWNHYENTLPQDGFGRLGLYCADCLDGPCRLSPFEPAETATICGFDRAELELRSLLRLIGAPVRDTGEPLAEVLAAARSVCPRNEGSDGSTRFGRGVLDAAKLNILAHGVPRPRLKECERVFESVLGAGAFKVNLIGDCCPHRETAGDYAGAEFAIMTGLVDLYIYGERLPARGRCVAEAFGTPVLPCAADPEQMARLALDAFGGRGKRLKLGVADNGVWQREVYSVGGALKAAKKYPKLRLLAGSGSIKQTAGESLLAIADGLLADGDTAVLAFGDAAATLGLHRVANNNLFYVCGSAAAVADHAAEIAGKDVSAMMPQLSSGADLALLFALIADGIPASTDAQLPVSHPEMWGLGGSAR